MDAAATKRTRLVLLPGLDGTEIFFRPLMRELPDWIEPVVVQYPAAGRGYEDLLPLVARALDGADGAWVLGWSFGGPLALMLAQREPGRVRGVILAASFVRAPQRALAWFSFALRGPVVWSIRAARRLPLWLLRRGSDEFRRDKAEVWRRVSAFTLAARVRTIARVDAREALRSCTRPLVYLAGAEDSVVPPANAAGIAALLPATRVVTIPGDHFALYHHAREAAPRIAEIVRVDARSPARRDG